MSAQQISNDSSSKDVTNKTYKVLIVGCGHSGIVNAVKLREAGINDFLIIEKAERIGGTWRENTYPGCGCDVPSAFYSYSFNLNPNWSYAFSRQGEILSYMDETFEKMQLKDKLKLNTEVLQAEWSSTKRLWMVETNQGLFESQFIIFSTGPLTQPLIPDIKGLNEFKGEVFHSAKWNHNYDLNGKRVAVIGTGASAVQFIPEIQKQVKSLTIFQRTAPWILPRSDRKIPTWQKKLTEKFISIQKLERNTAQTFLLIVNYALIHPWLMKKVEPSIKRLIARMVKDPELLKNITPNFTLGCKRIIFSHNYFSAIQKPNVKLIPHGLIEVDGNTLIAANGERKEVDVIILGTGFDLASFPIASRIKCQDGRMLADRWREEGAQAYLGTTVKELPNAFYMVGPNIMVYSSFITIAEWQTAYIVDAIRKADRNNIEVIWLSKKTSDSYNSVVQEKLKTTVWNSGGCKSYYLDEKGINHASWPWTVPALKRKLSHFDLVSYEIKLRGIPDNEKPITDKWWERMHEVKKERFSIVTNKN